MGTTIYILLALPLLTFVLLALGGKWMKPKVAGIAGTLSILAVMLLAYGTAAHYFTGARDAAGALPEITVFNFKWLPLGESLSIDLGALLSPI